MDDRQKQGLGVAFNEANLLGVEIAAAERVAAITLEVFTLPKSGPPADDRRLSILLYPIGRVAASLRGGHWDDRSAPILPLELDQLVDTIRELGCQPIYGWEFFDLPESDFTQWCDRLSLDQSFGDDGRTHSMTLFQEGVSKHLDLRIWFDSIRIRDAQGRALGIDDVIAGGVRWWYGLPSGDERSQGKGITPLADDPDACSGRE
jgi:hypothetical protein